MIQSLICITCYPREFNISNMCQSIKKSWLYKCLPRYNTKKQLNYTHYYILISTEEKASPLIGIKKSSMLLKKKWRWKKENTSYDRAPHIFELIVVLPVINVHACWLHVIAILFLASIALEYFAFHRFVYVRWCLIGRKYDSSSTLALHFSQLSYSKLYEFGADRRIIIIDVSSGIILGEEYL